MLGAHLWPAEGPERGTVIVNAATGVRARFYHRYARFLASAGFAVVTYDYRGIGLSRPPRLRTSGITWRDWGEKDFEAVLRWTIARKPAVPPLVVGHSIGGFLIGFAESAPEIGRILTVGAQYAYWGDYALASRLRMILRWHVAMPALAALVGYFPGMRLGWLEDLPAGVAYEWSFRRARMELSYPVNQRPEVLNSFGRVRAPILALAFEDDPFATRPAMTRTLSYFEGSRERRFACIEPRDVGAVAMGHFAPFKSGAAAGFWPITLAWLADGIASVPSTPFRSKETVETE